MILYKKALGLSVLLFFLGVGFIYHNKMNTDVRSLNEKLELLTSKLSKTEKTSEENSDIVRSWACLQPKVKDTVVQIFAHMAQINLLEPYKSPNQYEATGSGFFISEDKLITNAHVIDQAKAIYIQIPSFGKKRFTVQVVGISPERDLAVLQLQDKELQEIKKGLGKISHLTLGDSDSVHRADEIMALGYPLGQQSLKSTTGVVSGREMHMIQISAPINPGNSGGPSLNCQGEVIGVNSAGIMEAQNVGYIIPSNEVKLFLKQIEQMPENGSIKLLRRPYLGILYNNASEELINYLGNPQPGGLYVVETIKGSPLQKAGILSGDMIYAINGHTIDIFGDVTVPGSEDKLSIVSYLSRLALGDDINLLVYRNGKKHKIKFKFEQVKTGIGRIFPGYEDIDYEILGGMVLMQLSLNHLPLLVKVSPELARFADPKNQATPAVAITHIFPDSEALRSRALAVGGILSEINGQKIETLDDVRKAIKRSSSTGNLTIKTSEHVFTVLNFDQMLKDEKKLSATYFYPVSKTLQPLMPKDHKAA
ncbi:trypsin-like peptidase domain-containing protein [Candidatus Dependentiae bacterium]|nr:trypsin-like peptidase domain-containing protein [Candidatus Dependentiae bacterium]